MERVAIYARVSTPQQLEEGNGLDSQILACRDYAAAHGYAVAAVFQEIKSGRGLSGRKQLDALRGLVRAGDVEVILAYAVDRLTRDAAHLHYLMIEAESAGARIEFVAERLDDTPEGKLLHAVRGFVAEIERLKNGERSKIGIRARVKRGLPPSGAVPYGYRWRTDAHEAYVTDEAAASVVRRIFTEAARGVSIIEIIKRLDADAVPTPRHAAGWNERTVATMLRNPIYQGNAYAYRWRRRQPTVLAELAGRVREHWEPAPREEWEPLPDSVAPALVSAETWEMANAWVAAHRHGSLLDYPYPDAYLLGGGIARCGLCGRPLLGRGSPATQLYYRCSGPRSERRPCTTVGPDARVLDHRVWTRVIRTAMDGGPDEVRRPKVAESRIWLDDAGARQQEAEIAALLANLRQRLTEVVHDPVGSAAIGTDSPTGDDLRTLTARLQAVEATRIHLDQQRDRSAALRSTWADLTAHCVDDPSGMSDLPFAQKRDWLIHLGIVVRVWSRERGRLYEVTSSIAPAAPAAGGLPLLTPRESARVAERAARRTPSGFLRRDS